MVNSNRLTFLCIASYEKGHDFIRACKDLGNKVYLLTSESLKNVEWPREHLDDIFFIPDNNKEWDMQDIIHSVCYLARTVKIDRIVALDDYDVEKAATLREHMRVPGMGETTVRFFRDKLAMRKRAKEVGLNVPEFVHALNNDEINNFISNVEPPYILKPRMQAGAVGIKKLESGEELWKTLHELGDLQSYYLIEQFITGNIFHVDTIQFNKEVVFSIASEYGLPPFEVAHEGRVFTSRIMKRDSVIANKLKGMNGEVLKGMGLVKGISHTEFIRSDKNDNLYFLETSARVGGANLSELVKAGTGINLWTEWAKTESQNQYKIPEFQEDYAAIITSLAKQETPDMSLFNEPEIVWRLSKRYHAGLVIKSNSYDRITELIENYTQKFYDNFFISHPMGDKSSL